MKYKILSLVIGILLVIGFVSAGGIGAVTNFLTSKMKTDIQVAETYADNYKNNKITDYNIEKIEANSGSEELIIYWKATMSHQGEIIEYIDNGNEYIENTYIGTIYDINEVLTSKIPKEICINTDTGKDNCTLVEKYENCYNEVEPSEDNCVFVGEYEDCYDIMEIQCHEVTKKEIDNLIDKHAEAFFENWKPKVSVVLEEYQ